MYKRQVVAATEESRPTRRLTLRTQLKVTGHSWIAARVGGSGYYQSPSHHDGWRRGVFAHTSPIYISRGGDWDHFDLAGVQYMLTLVDGSLSYIRDLSPRRPESLVSHHHGEKDHAAFLERPFIQAREALHRRLHEHGFEPR